MKVIYITGGIRVKKLIIINGTMGAGKTTVCNELLKALSKSVFLDGDWCWNMNPFIVTEETKTMVIDNITHLLKNFLICSEYEYVIFCWVMHQETIFEDILNRLSDVEFKLHKITLMLSKKALQDRLLKDISNNVRTHNIIERSIQRLELYEKMDTVKIDVSLKSPREVAKEIIQYIGG